MMEHENEETHGRRSRREREEVPSREGYRRGGCTVKEGMLSRVGEGKSKLPGPYIRRRKQKGKTHRVLELSKA